MTAPEARVLALIALTLLVAGGVWLLGAYGLLAGGVVLLAVALFGPIDEERGRREPVPATAARRP